jgi:hypothetical protein
MYSQSQLMNGNESSSQSKDHPQQPNIHLPGVDSIPLAGPGFAATLCHGYTVAKLKDCL